MRGAGADALSAHPRVLAEGGRSGHALPGAVLSATSSTEPYRPSAAMPGAAPAHELGVHVGGAPLDEALGGIQIAVDARDAQLRFRLGLR